jgi:hypothetical protein
MYTIFHLPCTLAVEEGFALEGSEKFHKRRHLIEINQHIA